MRVVNVEIKLTILGRIVSYVHEDVINIVVNEDGARQCGVDLLYKLEQLGVERHDFLVYAVYALPVGVGPGNLARHAPKRPNIDHHDLPCT